MLEDLRDGEFRRALREIDGLVEQQPCKEHHVGGGIAAPKWQSLEK